MTVLKANNSILKANGKILVHPETSGNTVVIGGRTYPTVQIGGQIWMAENLDYQWNGLAIRPHDAPNTPAAWYYNNDSATYGNDGTRKCGLLYNWHAVQYLENNKETLCPGWHVPTRTEWETLFNTIGNSDKGKRLKASNISWAPNWGGTDEYGFGILPSGYCWGDDYFAEIGSSASIWTASAVGNTKAYDIDLYYASDSIGFGDNDRRYGCSLRLVKDSA